MPSSFGTNSFFKKAISETISPRILSDFTTNLLDVTIDFFVHESKSFALLEIEMVLQHLTMLLIMGNLIFANTLLGISLIKTQELLMVIHHFIVLQNKEILMYANSF